MIFPLTAIWERYFLRELFKTFAIFLICFYGLFALIDYSTHAGSFKNYHFTWTETFGYYFYELIRQTDVLIPFTLLISVIKTLTSLNKNNELIALMMGGVKLERILLPFFAFTLFFTAIIYFSGEILQPKALTYDKELKIRRAFAKQKNRQGNKLHALKLKDDSSIAYTKYNPSSNELYDVIWIKSIDDLYRIKTLDLNQDPAIGKEVEHFSRDANTQIELTDRFNLLSLPSLQLNIPKLIDSITDPADLSISILKKKINANNPLLNQRQAHFVATYYYKLALLFSPFLATLTAIPFCLRFTRSLPIFFIYGLNLFFLFAFYLSLNSALILGEKQVISPVIAIWTPFSLFYIIFFFKYIKFRST